MRNALEAVIDKRSGTQTLERAMALLREISARGHFGWQLSDLAARCRLSKSTAHRLLTCLIRERMVRQRPADRHYLPGPMLFELGLSLPELGELRYSARGRLAALAKRASAVAFLFFRSGDDFVCAERLGSDDLKALTIFPGTRRPLVLSAGGAAMLLALPVPEARALIRRNFAALGAISKARGRAIRAMLERTHNEGFAINEGYIVPGVNAFALALRDASAVPFASIVLAGSARALPLERLAEFRRLLQAAAEDLQTPA